MSDPPDDPPEDAPSVEFDPEPTELDESGDESEPVDGDGASENAETDNAEEPEESIEHTEADDGGESEDAEESVEATERDEGDGTEDADESVDGTEPGSKTETDEEGGPSAGDDEGLDSELLDDVRSAFEESPEPGGHAGEPMFDAGDSATESDGAVADADDPSVGGRTGADGTATDGEQSDCEAGGHAVSDETTEPEEVSGTADGTDGDESAESTASNDRSEPHDERADGDRDDEASHDERATEPNQTDDETTADESETPTDDGEESDEPDEDALRASTSGESENPDVTDERRGPLADLVGEVNEEPTDDGSVDEQPATDEAVNEPTTDDSGEVGQTSVSDADESVPDGELGGESVSEDAPLAGLVEEMRSAEAEADDAPLFEPEAGEPEAEEPETDWTELADQEDALERPDPEAEAERVSDARWVTSESEAEPEHVVNKREYCQRCPRLGGPPELTCTNEGTAIVEVVDSEHFRVRGCPMIGEDGPTFEGGDS